MADPLRVDRRPSPVETSLAENRDLPQFWRTTMWDAIGVALVSRAMAATNRLDPRNPGYLASGLLITCVAAWVGVFFLCGHRRQRDEPDAPLRVSTDMARPWP